MEKYKILITTSGTGSRLGNLTEYTNKSLVTVGDKAALSTIIESYPDDIEIVITLGYYGNHVKDYVTLAYPNKNITFVTVENFDGPGSSLINSMLCAKKYLQCQFIFHACDSLIGDAIPPPAYNWLGGFKGDESSDYRTLKTSGNDILSICEKGEDSFDSIYVGVAGIYDWKMFWNIAEQIYNDKDMQQSDCNVISQMMINDVDFRLIDFEQWYDIGNIKCLQKARKYFKKTVNVLDKEDESIHIFDDYVIKFFHNADIVKKRVQRADILHGKVPEIVSYRDNFYKCRRIQGDVLSKTVTENIFRDLLDWSDKNLWSETKESKEFYNNCKKFYYDKTISRIKTFVTKTGRKDKLEFINECEIPSAIDLLMSIPEDFLCSNKGYSYHGDFILDNIMYNNGSFTLIDYRQDFGGNLEYGDIFYDLSKMNHNLIFNHDIVNKNLYEISINSHNIKCDILRRDLFCQLQKILFDFVREKELDEKKVNILTSIIWLNMSALHQHPLNLFLYYFGRSHLYNSLKEYNIL